ncbi:MAG: Fic family protein [Patescibacteria group bacterium]|nr:Fic family protein [Patescibacteria group bacterium]
MEKEYFNRYQKKIKIDLADCFSNLKKDSPKIDLEYLIEASAVYSSNIEGNPMDLNSFMNTKAVKQKAKPKEYSEIVELISAYDFAQENELTENNLLKSHEMLSKSFLIKSRRGKYRDDKVGVFNQYGLVYLAVEPENVGREMKIFFRAINKLLKQDLNIKEVFYFASMLHLVFAHIHPFHDGNGRAARILEKWFLASKLKNKTWLIQSEKFYKENIKAYYKNINMGVNFYELNYDKCLPFLLLLPKALE